MSIIFGILIFCFVWSTLKDLAEVLDNRNVIRIMDDEDDYDRD